MKPGEERLEEIKVQDRVSLSIRDDLLSHITAQDEEIAALKAENERPRGALSVAEAHVVDWSAYQDAISAWEEGK